MTKSLDLDSNASRKIEDPIGPVSVLAIANAFIDVAKKHGKSLSNLELQKLVFIANGFSMAILDRPLYYQDNLAWKYGPVVPILYNKLKVYGKGKVLSKIETPYVLSDKSEEMQLIEEVYKAYGEKMPWELMEITHSSGSPWDTIWKDWPYGVIPQSLIRDYYKKLLKDA